MAVDRSKFDIDLEYGELREGALRDILSLREPAQIEVKSDGRCRDTGNLFVEYRQPDGQGGEKPSGIAVTTATFWAFEYDAEHWLIVPTVALKRAVKQALDAGLERMGGDGKRYRGVLVPIDWLVHREAA